VPERKARQPAPVDGAGEAAGVPSWKPRRADRLRDAQVVRCALLATPAYDGGDVPSALEYLGDQFRAAPHLRPIEDRRHVGFDRAFRDAKLDPNANVRRTLDEQS
jgi:hypothetical protein